MSITTPHACTPNCPLLHETAKLTQLIEGVATANTKLDLVDERLQRGSDKMEQFAVALHAQELFGAENRLRIVVLENDRARIVTAIETMTSISGRLETLERQRLNSDKAERETTTFTTQFKASWRTIVILLLALSGLIQLAANFTTGRQLFQR